MEVSRLRIEMARICNRVVSPRKRHGRGPTLRMLWIPTILVLMSASALAAQQASIKRLDGSTISASDIDATVTRLMNAAEVPGVGIAIFNDGKVAYLKTYGLRDKEKNLPLTPDSVMTAASLTKAAFATVVMELVEQGVLDLDKPVYQYLAQAAAGVSRLRRSSRRSTLQADHVAHVPRPHHWFSQLARLQRRSQAQHQFPARDRASPIPAKVLIWRNSWSRPSLRSRSTTDARAAVPA